MVGSAAVRTAEGLSAPSQTSFLPRDITSAPPELRLRSPEVDDLGTFASNRGRPIHRWYPFVEGYSSELVNRALRGKLTRDGLILDPFGGSGTTALAGAVAGHDSYFCEVNPYLAWVANAKVNETASASRLPSRQGLRELLHGIESDTPFAAKKNNPLLAVDQKRSFFPSGVAETVVGILEWIEGRLDGSLAELAKLACTTSLIPASNMIRRTDLRRRRSSDPPPLPIRALVSRQLRMIIEDVETVGSQIRGRTTQIAGDVRAISDAPGPIELIVTSPPYLNGTNYCRNTKLELLALSLMDSEEDLAELRTSSIAAGINNISLRRAPPRELSSVEMVAAVLDRVAYDKRIPALVRSYFSDMAVVLERLRALSLPTARFFLDIGDSRFAGTHVPTPQLLMQVAQGAGWRVVGIERLRKRTSYDGSELEQVLIEMNAV